MFRVIFTNAALKDVAKLKAARLDNNAKALIEIIKKPITHRFFDLMRYRLCVYASGTFNHFF